MMKLKTKMIGSARPIPVWLWFFALFAIGSFVSLLMYLDLYEKGRVNGNSVSSISHLFTGKNKDSDAGKASGQDKHGAVKKETADEQQNTGFDFYSLLPKMEVLVPESELSQHAGKNSEKIKEKDKQTPAATTTHAQPSTTTIKGNYYLQAGAFKDFQAADRMKANLGLLGIESKIVSVTLDSGVWHRVRIGPFTNLQQMNKTRDIMKSNRISSITVKVNS